MLKNGIFCRLVILVVFKVFLVVKNLQILIQIVPDSPMYYYWHALKTEFSFKSFGKYLRQIVWVGICLL